MTVASSAIRGVALLITMGTVVVSAYADTLDYTLVGSGGDTITFALPSNPVVAGANSSSGLDFLLQGIAVDVDGTTSSFDVQFVNAGSGGGLVIGTGLTAALDFSTLLTNNLGAQLYSGTEANPILLTESGTVLPAFTAIPGLLDEAFTLTTTHITATPEAPSVLLLGTGLLGLMVIGRKKFMANSLALHG
jgi:hypothetical protein